MRSKLKQPVRLGLTALFLTLISLTSCGGVLSDGRRKELLHDASQQYHKAVMWGEFDDASKFIPSDVRQEYIAKSREARRAESLVEIEQGKVEYSPDFREAKVEVLVRHFKNPDYSVVTRREIETWRFSNIKGWQRVETEVVGNTEQAGGPYYRGTL